MPKGELRLLKSLSGGLEEKSGVVLDLYFSFIQTWNNIFLTTSHHITSRKTFKLVMSKCS